MDIPDDLNKIKKMPFIALKEITPNEAMSLKKIFKISKIEDLAKVRIDLKQKSKLRKHGISAAKVQKWVIAAGIITNFADSEKRDIKEQKKIALLGLDNAGKTSIAKLISQNWHLDTFLLERKPTRGVERTELRTPYFNVNLWDLGGQEKYRDQYLANPEKYFYNIDLFIYVIDIQDHERIPESLKYLEKILEIFLYLNEVPQTTVLLHKADPGFVGLASTIELVNELSSKLDDLFPPEFVYEIFTTSIYNSISEKPEIIDSLKSLFGGRQTIHTQEFSEVINVIDKLTNMVLKFGSQVQKELTQIKSRIDILEHSIGRVTSDIPIGSPDDELELIRESSSYQPSEIKSIFNLKIEDIKEKGKQKEKVRELEEQKEIKEKKLVEKKKIGAKVKRKNPK
ncbi:MAG: hypothetical protein GF329_13065 [Candidatus Lokiarchaeota archaeon]|nr:hypothetical protein [Candidatus Lokiarchaeota archaeon]